MTPAAHWWFLLFTMAHGAPSAPMVMAGPFPEPRICYVAAATAIDAMRARSAGGTFRGACVTDPEGFVADDDILTFDQLAARGEPGGGR
jgi:hypothetical protein